MKEKNMENTLSFFALEDINIASPETCFRRYATDNKKLIDEVDDAHVIDALHVVGRKEFHFDKLDKTVINGSFYERNVRLADVDVEFLWVEESKCYFCVYKISAEIFKKYPDGTYRRYLDTLLNYNLLEDEDVKTVSKFYYFCYNVNTLGRTAGEIAFFQDEKECIEHMKKFDCSKYHFKEFLQDVVADVG